MFFSLDMSITSKVFLNTEMDSIWERATIYLKSHLNWGGPLSDVLSDIMMPQSDCWTSLLFYKILFKLLISKLKTALYSAKSGLQLSLTLKLRLRWYLNSGGSLKLRISTESASNVSLRLNVLLICQILARQVSHGVYDGVSKAKLQSHFECGNQIWIWLWGLH